MTKCTRFLGHKWSAWETSFGGERTEPSGQIVRQLAQRRICTICGFHQTEWLDEVKEIKPTVDEDIQND